MPAELTRDELREAMEHWKALTDLYEDTDPMVSELCRIEWQRAKHWYFFEDEHDDRRET